jgi:hypothetical protein
MPKAEKAEGTRAKRIIFGHSQPPENIGDFSKAYFARMFRRSFCEKYALAREDSRPVS